jgi:hypothetical protein
MEMQEVVDHMFLPLPGIPPVFISRTEGVYLHDGSGRRIIDASGGPLAVNIGYGRPEVADAAARALREVSYVLPVFASEARIELVKRTGSCSRGASQRLLCSGGRAKRRHCWPASTRCLGRNPDQGHPEPQLPRMTMLTLSISDVKVVRIFFPCKEP